MNSGNQNPLDKLKSVDWRGLVRSATNKVKQYTMNLSPLEIMVEEATNLEPWGPHGSVMSDIAEACFDPEGYRQVLGVLARRLQEKDERWRMCYKSLLLLEFLLKHGPTKIADDVLSSMSVLERLQRFQYKDDNARDHGANVRHRAEELIRLVNDPAALREEREKARANKAKYKGVSGEDMRRGATGFGSDSGPSSGRGAFDRSTLTRPGGGGGVTSSGTRGGNRQGWGSPSISSMADGRSSRFDNNEAQPGRNSSSRRDDDDDDAIAATRARIEKLRLEQRHGTSSGASIGTTTATSPGAGDGKGSSLSHKKKLMDVKVNPKIAASLGLKLAPPPPPQQQQQEGSASEAAMDNGIDLLGGLEDGPDDNARVLAGAAVDQSSAGGWDAFGGGDGGDGGDAARTDLAFDPFAQLDSNNTTTTTPPPPPPTTTTTISTLPTLHGGVPPPQHQQSNTIVRTALPEDAFSDLTGLNKPLQPMGQASGLGAPAMPLSAVSHGSGFADFDAFSGSSSPVSKAIADGGQHHNVTMTGGKDPFADLL